MTSFQCNKEAVHTVRCAGSTGWRHHKPPRTDTVLPRTGTSSDSHFISTAGCIATQLKSLYIIEDAELSVKGLHAQVQTIVTGVICQTGVMVSVNETRKVLIQPLYMGSYRHKPLFGIRHTYIVPLSIIHGNEYLLPLTPQPDSTRWYLSNTIDLKAFNLFYR